MNGKGRAAIGPNVRTTTSRGFEISYEDAGEGSALVLVNGLTGTAAEWRELGFVERLAGSHRVLSVEGGSYGSLHSAWSPRIKLVFPS